MQILDHGYVNLIEHWGSDERIIEAARMSTNKGFLGWEDTYRCKVCGRVMANDGGIHVTEGKWCQGEMKLLKGDKHLLAYLYGNDHSTPFEMAGAIFEVKAPIFVFREWHRHRTQSYNEVSARYTPLPHENYLPTVTQLMRNGGANKQAQGSKEISEDDAQKWSQLVREHYDTCEAIYQSGLRAGVPKELARIILPVGRYSRMRASSNLRNWLGFLRLRQAENAQWEIRQYADAVHDQLVTLFPRTMELYDAERVPSDD